MTSSPFVEENLMIAESLINNAVAQGSKLIVLPEMFSISRIESTDKLKVSEEYGKGIIQNFYLILQKKIKLGKPMDIA